MELNVTNLVSAPEEEINKPSAATTTEEMRKTKKFSFSCKEHKHQIFAVVTVSVGCLLLNFLYLCTTAALQRQITRDDFNQHLYLQVTWFVNLLPTLGALIAFGLVRRLGRKWSLLLAMLPAAIALALDSWGGDRMELVLGARGCVLVAVGFAYFAVPLYVVEVVSPELRGMLGMLPVVFYALGTLLFDLARTSQLGMRHFALFGAIFFAGLMLLIRESPYWCVSCWRREDARQALRWFRGGDEMTIDREMGEIAACYAGDKKACLRQVFGSGSTCIRTLGVVVVLAFLQKFTGENAVHQRDYRILEPARPSELIRDLAAIAGAMLSVVLVDRIGRRGILFLSVGLMAPALTVLGTVHYEMLQDVHDEQFEWLSGWLTTGEVFYTFSYTLGLLFVPWLLMGEVLPCRFKELCTCVVMIFYWLFRFFAIQSFHYAINQAALPFAFWTFALVCLASLPFIYFAVPETKFRSLHEIDREMRGDDEPNGGQRVTEV